MVNGRKITDLAEIRKFFPLVTEKYINGYCDEEESVLGTSDLELMRDCLCDLNTLVYDECKRRAAEGSDPACKGDPKGCESATCHLPATWGKANSILDKPEEQGIN